ncbi:AraC family transcriptional regulator [Nonomuraea sp. NPDC049655]|uniref:AraC family transcriptional regulator n=1 Tax=Nonomuraea sp. NPDC049655 TaxID=3364355 RepID=UPI0037A042FF
MLVGRQRPHRLLRERSADRRPEARGRRPRPGAPAPGGGADGRWADLATAAGYYDQSHMTAEFRTLMGVTPAAFFQGRLPALQPC